MSRERLPAPVAVPVDETVREPPPLPLPQPPSAETRVAAEEQVPLQDVLLDHRPRSDHVLDDVVEVLHRQVDVPVPSRSRRHGPSEGRGRTGWGVETDPRELLEAPE